ncbi:MAG TPA: pteridine reductase, partial [Cellvibrionaceae bacterium]
AQGFRVVIHYHNSEAQARALAANLNADRPDSATLVQANLNHISDVLKLAEAAQKRWQRLDVLVNNASSFYPTPIGSATEQQFDDLFGSNLKAPFFLAQALAPELKKNNGCMVNIADIHAEKPLKNHTLYCMAKAGNVMLTQSLARELAPDVRVNGIAPGAILWPGDAAELSDEAKQSILEKVALARTGEADDIARTLVFLVTNAPYITGQIIAVDGGRTLSH